MEEDIFRHETMLLMSNGEDSDRGEMERYSSKVDKVLWSLVITSMVLLVEMPMMIMIKWLLL